MNRCRPSIIVTVLFVLPLVACASAATEGPDAGVGIAFSDSGTPPVDASSPRDGSLVPPLVDGGTGPLPDASVPVTPDAAPEPTPDAAVGCTTALVELAANGNFDQGANGDWVEVSGASPPFALVTDELAGAHSGAFFAWLGGYPSGVDIMYQDVAVPLGATELALSGQRLLSTEETSGTFDSIDLELRTTTGALLETLASFNNGDATASWAPFTYTASGDYSGQSVRLYFRSQTDSSLNTNFFFDTLSLSATVCN